MRGFVLAAGFGTRLKPLTDHIPKALVPVCGVPLMERALGNLAAGGISELAVNAHYRADQISAFQRRSSHRFRVYYEEGAIRGTGGAFTFAREFLAGDDSFAVWNADIVADIDMRAVAHRFLDSGAIAGLLSVPGGEKKTILYERGSDRYVGTPPDTQDAHRYGGGEFIGIALYRREFLDFVTDTDFSIVPVWKRAAQAGADVRVFTLGRVYWKDTGTPGALAQIHYDVCTGHATLPLPEWITLDTGTRRAYHRRLGPALSRIGSLCWVETDSIPEDCRLLTSVVLAGATIPAGRGEIRDRIVTAWGELPL